MDQAITSAPKLKHWPSPQEYNEVIQLPQICFTDPVLASATVELTHLGLPRPISGGYACVYKLHSGDRDWALRCFLRAVDHDEHYREVSEFLQDAGIGHTVEFSYLRDGIKVSGNCYPALKMAWVDGQTLEHYVGSIVNSPTDLEQLADQFMKMCQELASVGMAHGDLQHGNILVAQKRLQLVDYDNMYVPKTKRTQSDELGHKNYQHPDRSARHFGPYLDNFSAWVIYAALRSIAIDNSLLHRLNGGDECLLFRAPDFAHPTHSFVFRVLETHPNQEINYLARIVRANLMRRVEDVPPLSTQPQTLPELPPLHSGEVSSEEITSDSSNNSATPDWLQGSKALTSRAVASCGIASPAPPELAWQPPEHALSFAPPRRVQLQTSVPILCQLALFLIPHVWLGIGAICFALTGIALGIIGVDHLGVIDHLDSYPTRSNRCELKYHFTKDGVTHPSKVDYCTEEVQKLKDGDLMIVRTLPWDYNFERPLSSQHRELSDYFVPIPVAIVFASLVLLGGSTAIWIGPLRQRHLVRNGIAVHGTVTAKLKDKDGRGNSRYWVWYSYMAPGSQNAPIEKRMQITGEGFNYIKEGDDVTVLCDPHDPRRSIIYRFCKYKALKP